MFTNFGREHIALILITLVTFGVIKGLYLDWFELLAALRTEVRSFEVAGQNPVLDEKLLQARLKQANLVLQRAERSMPKDGDLNAFLQDLAIKKGLGIQKLEKTEDQRWRLLVFGETSSLTEYLYELEQSGAPLDLQKSKLARGQRQTLEVVFEVVE